MAKDSQNKLSISCFDIVQKYGIKRGLQICKESGFDAVDYNLDCYRRPERPENSIYNGTDDAFESHFSEIRKIADNLELEIGQTHGATKNYDPIKEEQKEWFHTIAELDLKASSILGSPACVIHFIDSTRWGKQPPERMRSASNEMYTAIIPYAEKYKVKIALETFGAARVNGDRIRDFFADPTEFLWQYNNMDTTYKTMCVDTGHTHEAGSFWVPPAEDMIRILGKDISLLHLHDNSGHWDDHMLPGMGTIDWPAVFDALDDIGYNGNYNFEIRTNCYGDYLEEYIRFVGKYVRNFVDKKGRV